MRNLYLNVTVSGLTNSAGNGTVSTGPQHTNEIWFPSSVSITASGTQPTPTAPTIATCSIYAGSSVGATTYVDGTYQVLGASTSLIGGQLIYGGNQIFAVWANCNSAETITLNVTGYRQMP